MSNSEPSCLRCAPNGRLALDGQELTSGDQVELSVKQVWKDGKIIDDVWMAGRIEHNGHAYVFATPFWPRALPLAAGMIARRTEVAICSCGAKFYANTSGVDDHDCPLDQDGE